MAARDNGHVTTRQSGGWHHSRIGRALLVLLALALPAVQPGVAAADGTPEQPVSHTIVVNLAYPDAGVQEGEQLCLAIYAQGAPGDATQGAPAATTPLQSVCLGPGASQAHFEGLPHGTFVVAVPGPGSVWAVDRYQGQLVTTEVPDDPSYNAFGVDVALSLTPEMAGTTGSVQVNVYGCPPGTNGGGDATLWQSQCNALVGEVPLTLSGIGTIDDTSIAAVTAMQGNDAGRVEFTNLPAGAYHLEGELPANIAQDPAYFVASSIEGGTTTPLDPTETVAVRPTEIITIDLYLVMDDALADTAPPAAVAAPADAGTQPGAGIGDPNAGGNAPPGIAPPVVSGTLPDEPEPAAEPAATPAPDSTRQWIIRLPATGAGPTERPWPAPWLLALVAGALLAAGLSRRLLRGWPAC